MSASASTNTPFAPIAMRNLLVRALASAILLVPAAAGPSAAIAPGASGSPVRVDEVDRLIAEGRKLLDLKKPTEAEGVFRQAAELDGETLRTRMWVLRARMDQGGHSNDVLDGIQDLARTSDGVEIDYLFGMAYARRAEEQIAQGTRNAVDMNLQDAIVFLKSATEADADRFHDAFLPLARAAWYRVDLPLARVAIEEALRRHPDDPEVAFELGRIAFSQYTALQGSEDAAEPSLADHHWETARDAFRRTAELLGEPSKRDARATSLLGQAYAQLGNLMMWKQATAEARAAYARALEWNPPTVDLAMLYDRLGLEGLGEILEDAAPRFEKRFGKQDARDAAMLWWLGYTRYAAKKPAEAEAAFLEALKKAPGYANAWFYVAMARYDSKDYAGAAEALVKGWDADPAAIVRETSGNAEINAAKIEYLIGPLVEGARYADAAVLAEACAETVPSEARHWNNMGFFLREEAIRLSAVVDEEERARSRPTFERSLEAYERALELAPEDPTYLNDTAVVLHYYLDRDLDRALSLYADAARIADERLKARGMRPDTRELVQTALRDATNNKRALEKLLAKRRAGEGEQDRPEGG